MKVESGCGKRCRDHPARHGLDPAPGNVGLGQQAFTGTRINPAQDRRAFAAVDSEQQVGFCFLSTKHTASMSDIVDAPTVRAWRIESLRRQNPKACEDPFSDAHARPCRRSLPLYAACSERQTELDRPPFMQPNFLLSSSNPVVEASLGWRPSFLDAPWLPVVAVLAIRFAQGTAYPRYQPASGVRKSGAICYHPPTAPFEPLWWRVPLPADCPGDWGIS